MRKRILIRSLVFAVAALAALVAPAFAFEKVFEATYPLPSGAAFRSPT